MSTRLLLGALALAACASAAAAAESPTYIVVEPVQRSTTVPLRVIVSPVAPIESSPPRERFPMPIAAADPARFTMPIFGGRPGAYLTPVILPQPPSTVPLRSPAPGR
ncbi:MAG: hypothetical protein ACK47B_14830 [Armatimonadota bacterium]